MASLYAEISAFETGTLKVSDIHTLYYEISGNENGKPVVFLHGGPGGGTSELDRRYFDPEVYKIILFDQRGSGKSTPSACLEHNTTWDLVEDVERIRKHLGIHKWVVFGGSWGSTLALAYAETYPEPVKALVLRGIFTLRKSELVFFYQNGTSHIFPEAWDEFIAPIPEAERDDMMKAYHSQLNSDDDAIRLRAARAWSKWEMSTSRMNLDLEAVERAAQDDWANAFARIENHFFFNEGWMRDGQLLEKQAIDKIRHIPTVIVQGRYDVICPATTAWALKKAFPEAEFHIVPNAGHSSKEDGIAKLLVEATNKFRHL
ncbi:prolyl aminopeptidase serine peptidase [Dacryopinax primogenitus]|uniref:Proline iminopeptidase n=1 Tax=Dacryopinax primogenitus (strain DJM 731) TaxID=1858805 RepID=M5G3Z0_DACPD|nr:prolyl aminopeptidase serine peptidase [Dacryopinax primogenitus]EJU04971.1 prolyl aminopeptidase serine peptidase [Dacryopinax primogenitus]